MRWTFARLRTAPPLAWWGVLLASAIVGVLPLLPSGDAGADADPTEFSATRAFEHVRSIAGEPRPIGSAADARAGEYGPAGHRMMSPKLARSILTAVPGSS